jgi:uroporphyrinogen III methyltransferase / synthase
MTPEKPLSGKRIVITRAPEQAGILLQELKASGAEVIVLPFVEFRPPEDRGPFDAALSRLSEFDWIVFTSRNAVKFFCERLHELGRDLPSVASSRPKIAAIGAVTGDAAAREGLAPDVVAREARSGGEFVAQFSPKARGRRILLPQSEQSDGHVAEGLRESGALVTSVVAYRTCMPESLDRDELNRVCRDGADAFIFASPSAFRNFARTLGSEELKRFGEHSTVVAIGPTTTQAIRETGVPVKAEAATPSAREIVRAIIDYFSAAERAKVR